MGERCPVVPVPAKQLAVHVHVRKKGCQCHRMLWLIRMIMWAFTVKRHTDVPAAVLLRDAR